MGTSKKSSKKKDSRKDGERSEATPRVCVEGDGSHFDVPKSEARPSAMTKEEWLEKYGSVLQSERHYLERDPEWATNPTSWWYRTTGRANESPPLWMRDQWHISELDYVEGGDRYMTTIDQRRDEHLWAERMNLTGQAQGAPSSTIFGHRKEYLPASKSVSRSMYDRYQPSYQRIVNDEIPDTAAPPDGRFWKAGVAQGVTTNPYEKRMALSGHRKPIVIGPRSMNVVVDGEGHTLANMVRDVAWNHPNVVFAGYSLEHPVYRHMNLRLQVEREGSAERSLVESLEATKSVVGQLGSSMDDAVAEFAARSG
jgi:DNA-directed RNA polymerase subunit L